MCCLSDSVHKVPRWNFWKFLVNPEGKVVRFWRTDEPMESIRQEVTALVREIIVKKRGELWRRLTGRFWRGARRSLALWRERTGLNCYSEPLSTSPSMETGGSRTRALIPDGVCLWLTMTTMMNIQDDDRCCRRRIFLTTRVVALSFLFSTIGLKYFYIKSLEITHNDCFVLTDLTAECMSPSCFM